MKLEKNSKTSTSDTIERLQAEIKALKQELAERDGNTHKASVRTSFILPKDWSDLEKLNLAFKVMNADNSLQRTDTFDDRDDIFSNIWQALQQAILIAPVRTHEDILIKLDIMDFFSTAHIRNEKGELALANVNWLELEAHAVNKQLEALLEKLYTPEQKAKFKYIQNKNNELSEQAKSMTNKEKLELATALDTVASYNL